MVHWRRRMCHQFQRSVDCVWRQFNACRVTSWKLIREKIERKRLISKLLRNRSEKWPNGTSSLLIIFILLIGEILLEIGRTDEINVDCRFYFPIGKKNLFWREQHAHDELNIEIVYSCCVSSASIIMSNDKFATLVYAKTPKNAYARAHASERSHPHTKQQPQMKKSLFFPLSHRVLNSFVDILSLRHRNAFSQYYFRCHFLFLFLWFFDANAWQCQRAFRFRSSSRHQRLFFPVATAPREHMFIILLKFFVCHTS